VKTLPIGPEEIGPLWYARARLAYCTFGCFCWGDGIPAAGLWIMLHSRVMEKTAEYTMALLNRVIELLPASESRRALVYWSDVGPHFRTYKVLGGIAYDLLDQTKLDQHVNYGMEEHFKNVCDGRFGHDANILKQVSNSVVIEDVPDVCRILTKATAHQTLMDKPGSAERPRSHHEFFIPPHKDTISMHELVPKSLPCGIKSCHSWEFKLADRTINKATGELRRKSVLGIDGVTMTNVNAKAVGIAGARCGINQTCHPRIKLATVADAADPLVDAAAADAAASDEEPEIPNVETKVHLGWRCSYRTSMPDKLPAATFIARVNQKQSNFKYGTQNIVATSRRKTPEQIQAASNLRAHKRQVKKF
jgi:hypothetical protein